MSGHLGSLDSPHSFAVGCKKKRLGVSTVALTSPRPSVVDLVQAVHQLGSIPRTTAPDWLSTAFTVSDC
jgi:hypothetical protein